MNIVLFEENETGTRFARDDVRINHVTEILGRKTGDRFDAGIINGKSGKAILSRIGEKYVDLQFELNREEPPLPPIDVIVGLSRPQTNRKILQEATTVGARSLTFVSTERGEPSYANSKLWKTGEWRRHVVAGAAQAFSTLIPSVVFGISLEEAIAQLDFSGERIAMDNYEAKRHLADIQFSQSSIVVAIGSERGWTRSERRALRAEEFELAHLGGRPLRTETAVVAGLSFLNHRFRS
jgi:RsmE family RNA methyltransferase